jgi:hypothetical protein
MAGNNVQWVSSQKGKTQLVVDNYVFMSNGKGKAVGVRYWKCSTSGCAVSARTQGDRLTEINGCLTPGDHGHVNDSAKISSMTMKVSCRQCSFICILHVSVWGKFTPVTRSEVSMVRTEVYTLCSYSVPFIQLAYIQSVILLCHSAE